jgi:hypothetical protein
LESSSLFLIDIYHNYPDQVLQIFNEWFNGKKNQKEKIFAKYNFNPDNNNSEYIRHKEWREKYKLMTTPIILINGYRLPENYKIEDIRFLTEFNIDIK